MAEVDAMTTAVGVRWGSHQQLMCCLAVHRSCQSLCGGHPAGSGPSPPAGAASLKCEPTLLTERQAPVRQGTTQKSMQTRHLLAEALQGAKVSSLPDIGDIASQTEVIEANPMQNRAIHNN